MAGLIPQHFIDELVARSDIVELIGHRVPLRKAGREYKACCPFHEEKTPSFTVSQVKQFYHCFGCGAHGTALGFLMEHDHMGFVEAIEELASMAGMEVPREAGAEGPGLALYELMEKATALYRRLLKEDRAAVDYLKGRGLRGEIVAEFGIGYAPARWDTVLEAFGKDPAGISSLVEAGLIAARDSGDGHYDRFRNRIMFPIRDGRGRVIAFGGRIPGTPAEREAKYLNSPETPLFHKGRELYGLFEARKALRDIPRLLVVEGYMDVVALAEHGIRNSVATLGTATTADHLQRLFRVTEEVVFAFDGDRAGREAAWRALQNALPCIEGGRQLRFLFLPDGEDPDSLVRAEGAKAFEARVDQAEPLSEFLLRRLASEVDMDSIDGRARMLELAAPLVSRIPQGVYRTLLTEQLARAAHSDPQRLAPMLERSAAAAKPVGGAAAAPGRRPMRRPEPSAGRGNAIRQAIRLVLHHPSCAAELRDPTPLQDIERPGMDVLVELLAMARERPDISTAGLLERWRERPEGRHLMKLAAGEMLVEADAAAAELEGLTEVLLEETRRQRMSELIARRDGGESLSDGEKTELLELLAGRRGGEARAH